MPNNPVTDPITDQQMAFAHAALRERVLKRLWEIADLTPEATRNSVTGQVKAIAMIVAMEGLIPDRRAGSSDKNSVPRPHNPNIYVAEWLRRQRGETINPEPSPDQAQDAPADLPLPPNPILRPANPSPSAPRKQPRRRFSPQRSLLLPP